MTDDGRRGIARFAATWDAFVLEWCAGVLPPLSEAEISHCFDVLERYWPEGFEELRTIVPENRFYKVVGLSMTGLYLDIASRLRNFPELLHRFRMSERAALSEMVVAVRFVIEGFEVAFAPAVGNKKPDLEVSLPSGERVLVEIVTPAIAVELRGLMKTVETLIDRVEAYCEGKRVEIEFAGEPRPQDITEMVEAVREPAGRGCRAVGHAGWIEILDADDDVERMVRGSAETQGRRPFYFMSGRKAEAGRGGIRVRVPVDADRRVPQMIDRKVKQLPPGECNLVVMDFSDAPFAAAREWHELAVRRFQPSVNTRLGGVARLECGLRRDGMAVEMWTFAANPYAVKPLPASIVDLFGKIATTEHRHSVRTIRQYGLMPPPTAFDQPATSR